MSDLTATQQLFDLILEQRTILLELKHFAEKQFQIVQQNELGKLVSLLATKQQDSTFAGSGSSTQSVS
jgi:hypothetical protein